MTTDPTRGVGYHDLLRDLAQPGCPVCRGANRSARRYLDSLLWEFVNDGGVRDRLRAAHGFCREHAMLALAVARQQAGSLGVAILYQDFLAHVREEVAAAIEASLAGPRRRATRSINAMLAPHAKCAACESAEATARNYLAVLASSEPDDEIGAAARRPLRTLCVPHLRTGLAEAGEDARARERLVEIYVRAEEETRRDLQEFVRKQDYRFHHEPVGQEGDSWIRAVSTMVGTPALLPAAAPVIEEQRGRS